MDQDITNAKDTFALQKIKAQDERDNRKVMQQIANSQAALNVATGKQIDDSDAAEIRRSVVLAIAANYMTTNANATLPETVLADAQKDAARLKAAVDEVMKLM